MSYYTQVLKMYFYLQFKETIKCEICEYTYQTVLMKLQKNIDMATINKIQVIKISHVPKLQN